MVSGGRSCLCRLSDVKSRTTCEHGLSLWHSSVAILSPSSLLTNESCFNVTVLMLRTNSSLCGISSPLCDFYSASATGFIGS